VVGQNNWSDVPGVHRDTAAAAAFRRVGRAGDAFVTEEPLGLAVDQDDAAGVVHDHNGVRSRFQQVAVAGLDQLGIAQDFEMSDVLFVGDKALDLPLLIADDSRRMLM